MQEIDQRLQKKIWKICENWPKKWKKSLTAFQNCSKIAENSWKLNKNWAKIWKKKSLKIIEIRVKKLIEILFKNSEKKDKIMLKNKQNGY